MCTEELHCTTLCCDLYALQLSKVLSQLLYAHHRQPEEVLEVCALYQKEAMQRKLLFNEVEVVTVACYPPCSMSHDMHVGSQVQELRGNISVFFRCHYASSDLGKDRVICVTGQGRKKIFEFEREYDMQMQQETYLRTLSWPSRPVLMATMPASLHTDRRGLGRLTP